MEKVVNYLKEDGFSYPLPCGSGLNLLPDGNIIRLKSPPPAYMISLKDIFMLS